MRTLAVSNGDLVLGPGGFATVSGQTKIKQELGAALREPVGTDRFHPAWGSVLNRYLGSGIGETLTHQIRVEINRVIANYVYIQSQVIKRDYTRGLASRYSAAEVIEDIISIEIRQVLDALYVRINLRTVAGETVTILSSVEP